MSSSCYSVAAPQNFALRSKIMEGDDNIDGFFLDMELVEKLTSLSREEEEHHWKKCCIYRVPSYMREANPEAYSPKLFSLGPYHHHGNAAPHLKEMEKHKYRALAHVLKRTRLRVEDFIEALRPLKKELMESYNDLDGGWREDEDKFLQLMVLDGVFLIEVLQVHVNERNPLLMGYSPDDPVFSSTRSGPSSNILLIRNDVYLLENQLPGLLITRLSSMIKEREDESSNLLRPGGANLSPEDDDQSDVREKKDEMGEDIKPDQRIINVDLHLLDGWRKTVIRSHKEGVPRNYPVSHVFSTATQLHEAGIEFEINNESSGDLDIKFDKKTGILTLPCINVNWATQNQVLNMVAYEIQQFPGDRHEISSYIVFISYLASTAQDVALLWDKGILLSNLSSHEQMVDFFQKLFRDMRYQPLTCFEDLRRDVEEYGQRNMKKWKRRFREWRKNLRDTYFKSPWSVLSLMAAIILLSLSLLGTLYTAVSYYKPGP